MQRERRSLKLPQLRNSWSYQKLEGARQDPLWEGRECVMPTAWFQTSSIQNHERINLYFLNHPVCGTLLWQPWKNNILIYAIRSQDKGYSWQSNRKGTEDWLLGVLIILLLYNLGVGYMGVFSMWEFIVLYIYYIYTFLYLYILK